MSLLGLRRVGVATIVRLQLVCAMILMASMTSLIPTATAEPLISEDDPVFGYEIRVMNLYTDGSANAWCAFSWDISTMYPCVGHFSMNQHGVYFCAAQQFTWNGNECVLGVGPI